MANDFVFGVVSWRVQHTAWFRRMERVFREARSCDCSLRESQCTYGHPVGTGESSSRETMGVGRMRSSIARMQKENELRSSIQISPWMFGLLYCLWFCWSLYRQLYYRIFKNTKVIVTLIKTTEHFVWKKRYRIRFLLNYWKVCV